jgi:hypothetical protein
MFNVVAEIPELVLFFEWRLRHAEKMVGREYQREDEEVMELLR